MTELKPCPFCGSQSKLVRRNENRLIFIKCSNSDCGLVTPFSFSSDDDAGLYWNRRVAPPDVVPAEKVRELVETLVRNSISMDTNPASPMTVARQMAYRECAIKLTALLLERNWEVGRG